MVTLTDFQFLDWVRLAAFFRDDLHKELVQLGMDYGEAFIVVRSEAVQKSDVIEFYHNFGRAYPEIFERFIQSYWDRYKKIIDNRPNGGNKI